MKSIEAAVIGAVARDPELKQSKAGKPWLALSIGVDNGEEDADGNRLLEWVKVIAFGETAERLAATVRKGDRVYAEGALKVERWRRVPRVPPYPYRRSRSKRSARSAIGRNRAKHQPRPASERQSEYADEDTFA